MATAVCEKHKLRYDPATQSGCAICRRESAGGAPAAASRPAAAPKTGIAVPLLAALGIWGATGGVLFSAHREIANAYQAEVALASGESLPVAADAEQDPSGGLPEQDPIAEVQALQQAREQRTGAEEQLAVPSPESLSQSPETLDQVEAVDTSPVEIQTESGGSGDGGDG